MFGRKAPERQTVPVDSRETNLRGLSQEDLTSGVPEPKAPVSKSNTLLRGSKLIGNIHIICDLELSGDVVGNIFSKEKANITIKGSCKGNIETVAGNVTIEGELLTGNIVTGNDVRVTGKFFGGEIRAKGKIYINGEFSGKLEANEIELGPNANGEGELSYREAIAIARGAQVEVKINRSAHEVKMVSGPAEDNVVEMIPASNVLQLGR